MVLVTFIYNGENKTFDYSNPNSKLKEILKRFSTDMKVNLESIIFLFNGKIINEDLELKDLISNINQNGINILVYDKNNYEHKENKENKEKDDESENINDDIIISKYPICPICGGIMRVDIKDYKINLFECDKGHEFKGLTFQKYIEMQKLDETKIVCDNCKQTNKADTFGNKFFKCLSCQMNLCPLCKTQHNNSHEIISYDEKDFKCQIHNDSYISYCNQCKTNICIECEDEHDNHEITSLRKIFPNKNNLNNYNKELKDKIDKFNKHINEIIMKINEIVKIMNIYYKIVNNHLANYQPKKRNYQIFQNINDFQKNKIILDDITEIINEDDIRIKIDYIFKIYNKIKGKKETYEKTIENKNTINNQFKGNENNEQKYLEETNKYDELNKKYEQLYIENKNNIEEKNKLNKKISELEEIKKKYQIMKNDFDKSNSEKSKYLEERNIFDELKKELEKYKGEKNKIEKNNIELEKQKLQQLYNELLNKYQDEKNQYAHLKKAYENQKKQIEEKNNKLELSKGLEDKKKGIHEYKINHNESVGKLNNYAHLGIKCKKCFEEPIIGYRYKCCKCKNYNLCQKCEEKNEISEEHPHYFIKIRNECKEGDEITQNPSSIMLSDTIDNAINKNIINEKGIIKSEIDENIDKINEFRRNYDLYYNDDFSNEQILEVLKKNNFNYAKAFCSLFE